MSRGSDQSNAAATNAVGQNQQLFGGSQALYGQLAPQLTAQAANPQGFGPEGLARLDTAAQQSAGGGQAAATGAAALEDSRTRNAGGSGMALAKAARQSGKNLTDATLQTRIANEGLKEEQRSGAQKGLEGLYGTNVGGGNQALSGVASNVNANANQEDASWGWAKNILQPVLSAAGKFAGGGRWLMAGFQVGPLQRDPQALRNPILDEIDNAATNAHAQLSPQAQAALSKAGAPVPGQPAPTGPQPTITTPRAAAPSIAPVPQSPTQQANATELARITAPPPSDPALVHTHANTGTAGVNQIHSPWARIPLQIASAIGETFAPRLAAAIPGTESHHQMLVGEREGALKQDELQREGEEKARTAASTQEHLAGETEHNLAQADALRNPKVTPEKEDVHAIYAEAVRDAMKRGVDPGSDPKVQQTLAAVTALNKEPAPSKPDVHVLLAEAIKDAQDKGNDPGADPKVQQITAAIRATAATPNDTEVIHKQIGGKPHNVMVKKGTGEVVADLGELGEKETAGETGTWELIEQNGKPMQMNSRSGAIRPAPEGVGRLGTAERAEEKVKPIRDAVTFGRTYLNSGQFTGSEDEALINKAAGMMTLGVTKRPVSPNQQKTILGARSAMQGLKASATHLLSPNAPYLDDTQRANLVKTMEDIAKSEGLSAAPASNAPAGGGAAATHRYNPATGKIEPIK